MRIKLENGIEKTEVEHEENEKGVEKDEERQRTG